MPAKVPILESGKLYVINSRILEMNEEVVLGLSKAKTSSRGVMQI